MPRLYIDVSSLVRWTGPPVGMIRVQSEIVLQGRACADTILVFFDLESKTFRRMRPEHAERVLGPEGCIDFWRPSGWRRLVPSRYTVFLALERLRLTRGRQGATLAEHLQRLLLGLRRHTLAVVDQDGRRLSRVPRSLALGEEVKPGPQDVVLLAGSGWYHVPAAPLAALKAQLGFRLAAMCYDIIPLQRPDWFPPEDAAAFRDYWHQLLRLADLLIVNATVIARDIAAYAASASILPGALRVVPLGSWPAQNGACAGLPRELQAGRYTMFVSTIEPRKGHAMLLKAWRRLLDAGLAGPGRFQLVLVGRFGWMVDAVLADIASLSALGAVIHLPHADDETMRTLYRHAAFCLYPSEYEGFGLPVVEAFSYGKPVIVSSGGALPETAGGLATCLDPHDADAWVRAIGDWIARPALPQQAAAKIEAAFVPRDWSLVAAELLDAARTAGGRNPPPSISRAGDIAIAREGVHS